MNARRIAAVLVLTVIGVIGLVAYNPKPIHPATERKDVTATNWAGYVDAATLPKVSATWKVGVSANPADVVDQWVGYGGVKTGTILQAGVQTQGVNAWAWVEDYPALPVYLKIRTPVLSTVSVTVTNRGNVTIKTAEQTYHKHFNFNFSGASSEWILETHNKLGAGNLEGLWSFEHTNRPSNAQAWNEPTISAKEIAK